MPFIHSIVARAFLAAASVLLSSLSASVPVRAADLKLEKNRMHFFREIMLFLDEKDPLALKEGLLQAPAAGSSTAQRRQYQELENGSEEAHENIILPAQRRLCAKIQVDLACDAAGVYQAHAEGIGELVKLVKLPLVTHPPDEALRRTTSTSRALRFPIICSCRSLTSRCRPADPCWSSGIGAAGRRSQSRRRGHRDGPSHDRRARALASPAVTSGAGSTSWWNRRTAS